MLSFSRPVSLRDRIPAPSGAAIATTAAVGISALAAGAVTYSLLRRFAFLSPASPTANVAGAQSGTDSQHSQNWALLC